MVELALQHDAHELLRGRGHIPEALSEGHHREAIVFQCLHHHGGVPPVVCDLTDVELFTQLQDELFNETVVNDIALRRHDEALLFPFVIHDMVAPDAQLQRILREPEERQHNVLLVLVPGREHQHYRGQVAGGRQVQSSVTCAAFKLIGADYTTALIPLVHRHPADGLLDPLVQAQLAEHVLVGGRLLGLTESVSHLVDGDGLIQRWIGLVPVLFIRPVRLVRQAEQHRVEPWICLPALDDIQRLLVNLPADAVPIRARRRQQEPQRLLPSVAGTLGHDVVQGAGRLGVQLVKDAGADVQAVLGGDLARQYLVNAAGRLEHHALGGGYDLDAPR